jgi:type IV pilus assembly protein PilY1
MTHCILDLSPFDTAGDGYTDTVYAGDLGGQMFAFEDRNKDGAWNSRKLFVCPVEEGKRKKIFHSPDAVREICGEMIFFGTGDRAHPTRTDVENRIYAIKNTWEDEETFTTLTEDDLVDVTEDLIQLGTIAQRGQEAVDLQNADGWYFLLENEGEKMVSTPVVFDGVLWFTTYTPAPESEESEEEDPCSANAGRGVARLYAVDYETGASVYDFSPTVETDGDGEVVALGKLDRCATIGTSIPSAPVIAVLEGGPMLYVGVEGGIPGRPIEDTTVLNIYFWRQLF